MKKHILSLILFIFFMSLPKLYAQPHAEFSLSAGEGCINDEVSFINLSFGGVVSYLWDFGDGNTSNLASPTHTFSGIGSFTISLKVTDGSGLTDTWSEDYTVRPPKADFVLNPPIGCAIPHTVFFTDRSTLPDTWLWDFGDGNTSTLQNPVHNYTSTGEFEVKLTVTDTIYGCSDSIIKKVRVNIPSAEITGTGHFGCGPLTVNFTENSSNSGPDAITGWLWDFGDGNTSTVQTPTHTYETPNVYTVSLRVTTESGCTSTDVKSNFVQVIGPDVKFGTASLPTDPQITSGLAPYTVNFADHTIFGAPIISWQWEFGDGTTSNLQNPTHTYSNPGNYTVSLTIMDIDGCSRTLSKTDYISALAPEISVSSSESGALTDGGTDAQGDEVVGKSKTVTYTITNSGTATLTLTGTANITNLVNISGTPTVTSTSLSASGSTTLSALASTTFEVTYIPDCGSNFSFDISIANDDADENPFNFTVSGTARDTTAPVTPTLGTSTAQCSITVTTPTTMDNCSGLISGTTSDSTTFSSQGTHTILWTFTDAAGNSSTATQTVVIQDSIPPVAPTLATVTEQCSASVSTPTATDNCSGMVTGTTSDPTVLSSQGTHTILWTFTDSSGNSSTATQTVVIKDTIAPVPPTLSILTAQCSTTVATPTATDNCSGLVTGTTSDPTVLSDQGTHTILWTFTDAVGNSSTATQTVVIQDMIAPVVPVLPELFSEDLLTLTPPTTSDNCSGSIVATTSNPLIYYDSGSYVVTWTFTDGVGNRSIALQKIRIERSGGGGGGTPPPSPEEDPCDKDTLAPVVPSILPINDSCRISLDIPTAEDNCSGTVTGVTTASLIYEQVGSYTVTWTFTDTAGNSSTAVQLITILYDQEVIDTQEACASFTWIDGVVYTESNNTATFETTDAQGCTSLHRLDLTINPLPDTTITLDNNILSAVHTRAQYQWIDCENGNTPIAGATQQSFAPTGVKGSYAVQITTAEGCTLTSDCIPYFDTTTLLVAEGISPNGDGVNDTWVIQGIENHPNAVIYVYNRSGEVVFSTLNGYNNDWRGDWNETGRTLPSAPYFYTLDRDADGKIDDYGWIYIQN